MRSRERSVYESSSDVYFVTSTVLGFVPIFSRAEIAHIFIENLIFYQTRGDFTLLAWVLMPEHFHLVLKRSQANDVSSILGNLKRMTSRQIQDCLRKADDRNLLGRMSVAASVQAAYDSKVWQGRFDCLVIMNERTLKEKIAYIHGNPVRRGLVQMPEQWKYSSASTYSGKDTGLVSVDCDWSCLGYGHAPSGKGS